MEPLSAVGPRGKPFFRCKEDGGLPARLVGESDVFTFPSTEEIHFEADGSGVQDSDVGSTMRARMSGRDHHQGSRGRLTTHRLVWHSPAASGWLALRLDAVASATIEAQFMRSRRCVIQLRGGPAGSQSGPVVAIKLAQDTRCDELLAHVEKAVAAAAWRNGSYDASTMGGLGRLMEQREARQTDVREVLDAAFTDLESLKQHAAQATAAARRVNITTSKVEGNEGAGLQRLLEDFGLMNVSGQMVAKGGTGRADVQADVAQVCQAALEKRGAFGMLMVHDVFCLVNRARGTAFVTAEEIMSAVRACSQQGGLLHLRKLGNTGAWALSLARCSDAETDRKLLELVRAAPLSAFRLATELGLTAAEAQYLLRDAEDRGVLVRDDAPESVFYYRNFFNDF